jgi:hypothetical protein
MRSTSTLRSVAVLASGVAALATAPSIARAGGDCTVCLSQCPTYPDQACDGWGCTTYPATCGTSECMENGYALKCGSGKPAE